MAVIVAGANGNWSSTGTWLGGVVPTSADDVYLNGFNVTLNTNVSVNSLNSTAYTATRHNPIMTSDTAPAGSASASSVETTFLAFRAFDGSAATAGNSWRAAVGVTTGWIQYEYNAPQIVTRYTIQSSDLAASNPFTWTFEAWDGSAWVTLHTVTSQVIALASTYDSGIFANTTAYTRYRHNITAINGGTQLRVGEINYFVTGFDRNAATGGSLLASTGGFSFSATGGGIPLNGPGAVPLIDVTAASGTITVSTNSTVTLHMTNGAIRHTGACNLEVNIPQIGGSGTNNVSCINKTSTGTLTFTGNIIGAVGSANASPLVNTGTGAVTIIGNLVGGTSTNGNGCVVSSNANVSVTGNISGGSQSASQGIVLNSGTLSVTGTITANAGPAIVASGNVTVVGNVTGGTVSDGITTAANISINVTGNLTGGSTSGAGVGSTNRNATLTLTGNLINTTAAMAAAVFRMFVNDTTTTQWIMRTPTLSPRILYSDDTFPNLPATGNVRQGTTYGPGGSNTGTLIVPNPANVLLGVGTDNTTGTYSTTPAAIATEIFTKLLSGTDFDTVGSFGKLVKDNLDATVSSRLASASYTAPANADIAAIKAKTDNLPSDPADNSDILSAIGSIPAAPSASTVASAVRTELTTELGRIDVATSTRLASASYTAPANADVAAIKAKTDNLPADPASETTLDEIKANTNLIPGAL